MVLTAAPSSPFGSRSRTRILVALRLLGSSYPRELARRLDTPIFAIRKALAGLERDGLIGSRLVGRTRLYTLSLAYRAHRELAAFLARLAEPGPARAEEVLPDGAEEARDLPWTNPAEAEPHAPPGRRSSADDGWKNW